MKELKKSSFTKTWEKVRCSIKILDNSNTKLSINNNQRTQNILLIKVISAVTDEVLHSDKIEKPFGMKFKTKYKANTAKRFWFA